MCGLLDGLDETLVGDGHLVVLGEDRDDAVLGEVGERGFLGVGLDEGKGLGLLHRDYLECGCGLDIGHNRHERRSVVDGLDSCFHDLLGLIGLSSGIVGTVPSSLTRRNRGLLRCGSLRPLDWLSVR